MAVITGKIQGKHREFNLNLNVATLMLESIFKTLSMAGCTVMYVNVGENELFS